MDKKKAMGWFIIIVMSLSILGFVGGTFFGEDEDSVQEYNNYTFYQVGGQWQTSVKNQKYTFQYPPADLENISVPAGINSWNGVERIYLAYQPNDTIDVIFHLNRLGGILFANSIRPQTACTVEENCPDIPIVDCNNSIGVIMRSGEENIFQENNCLVVYNNDTLELGRITERIIYGFLGVMP